MADLVHVAQSYLHYRGDLRAGLEVGQVMGPTTYGSSMFVVSVEWEPGHVWPDGSVGRTVVGMSALSPLAVGEVPWSPWGDPVAVPEAAAAAFGLREV